VLRGRERGATEDTENTERKRRVELPFWRVGSFCISECVARVGVVWRGLALIGNCGMPTLAGRACRRAGRGEAGVSMAPMAPGATLLLAARMVILYLKGWWCAAVMKI